MHEGVGGLVRDKSRAPVQVVLLGILTPGSQARRMPPRSSTWAKLRSTISPHLRMASRPTPDFNRVRKGQPDGYMISAPHGEPRRMRNSEAKRGVNKLTFSRAGLVLKCRRRRPSRRRPVF